MIKPDQPVLTRDDTYLLTHSLTQALTHQGVALTSYFLPLTSYLLLTKVSLLPLTSYLLPLTSYSSTYSPRCRSSAIASRARRSLECSRSWRRCSSGCPSTRPLKLLLTHSPWCINYCCINYRCSSGCPLMRPLKLLLTRSPWCSPALITYSGAH